MDTMQRRATAMQYGDAWVDEVHLLLALLGAPGSVAGRALRSCGFTRSSVRSDYEELLVQPGASSSTASPRATPRLNQTVGRAQGLAASRGARRTSSADYLVAILLGSGGMVHAIFARRPRAAERLAAALREAGVAVPVVPGNVRRPLGDRISIKTEDLREVMRQLREALPPGSPVAFNHDGKGAAWVIGPKGVDIRKFIAADLLVGDLPEDRRPE
jgi:ATP-dependent Clp protease ATP-binding subunit ClpA